MKKIIKNIIFALLCLCLIFSIFKLLFDNRKEISVSGKNKNEIIEMIRKEYEYPEKITNVKLKVLLGDGKLYLYNNLKLEKESLVGEGSEIFQYIIENGDRSGSKYIIMCFISLIGLLFYESCKGEDDGK